MRSERIYLNLPGLDRERLRRGLTKVGLGRRAGISPAAIFALYAEEYASPVIYGRLLAFFELDPATGERLLTLGIGPHEEAAAAS